MFLVKIIKLTFEKLIAGLDNEMRMKIGMEIKNIVWFEKVTIGNWEKKVSWGCVLYIIYLYSFNVIKCY